MSASLVGSEMCIRDSIDSVRWVAELLVCERPACSDFTSQQRIRPLRTSPVSYTHLTLPTICSV
eukprot:11072133-Alexandrium_andersonii.AAC.1